MPPEKLTGLVLIVLSLLTFSLLTALENRNLLSWIVWSVATLIGLNLYFKEPRDPEKDE